MRRVIRYILLTLGLFPLSFVLKASLPQVATGSWGSANNMLSPHDGGCSVVLLDGRILVSGGSDASGPTAKVDIFNTDGTWSSTSSMLSPRAHQVCAVLPSGQVLVVGGVTTGGGVTNSAELFDSTANTWLQLPAMSEARADATASVLQDGRVLVAGGQTSSGYSNTIEIFDPNAQTFSFAGTMSASRQNAAATVLQDGRVLIVGGSGVDANGNAIVLASSDVYDPSTGSVSAGPTLTMARSKHSATTQLDGKVVVIGGSDGTNSLGSIEVFDPTLGGNFAPVSASLATARSGHLSFLLPKNNEVLVVGGQSVVGGQPTDLSFAELYVPWGNQGAGAVQTTGSMSVARSQASGAPLSIVDGLLLVSGGSSQTSAELYSFATVKTDQADYAPGTTVTITGTGWQPGENVMLTLVESPLIDTHPALYAVADQNGNIFNNQFSPDSHDVNVRFYLTASGSQFQAQNTFTDAGSANVAFAASGLPSGTSISATIPAGGFTNNGGNTNKNAVVVTFTAPGPSSAMGTQPGSSFSYTFPASVTGSDGKQYTLSSSSPTSPFTTGADKSTTTVTATYGPATQATTLTISPASGTYDGTTNLSATLTSGGTAVSGVSVTFSLNGTLISSATTNSSGFASLSNIGLLGINAGTYPTGVSASFAGNSRFSASSGTAQLTVSKATPTITWANPADITYGTALSATQFNATASIPAIPNVPGTFVYTPASGTVLNAGAAQTLSVIFTPTDSSDYDTASKSVSINVSKANANITVTPYSVTYDANAHTATGVVTGVGGTALTGLDLSQTTHTNAGNYGDTWTFTDATGNYNNTSGTANDVIAKATAQISVTPYAVMYDGNPHTATGSATGGGGVDLSASLTLSGTTHTNAGDYPSDAWTFAGGTNYNDASGTVEDCIKKANATVSVTPYSVTYDGNAHTAGGTAVGVKGEALSGLDLSGTAHTNAGDYASDPWTFTDSTGNYNNANGTTHDHIDKANAIVNVTGYTVTYDGLPHTATGSATGVKGEALAGLDLSGTTHMNAGDYPSDPWNFTDATGNYNNSSGTAKDCIKKANAAISVTPYSVTYDGNAHTATGTASGVEPTPADLTSLLHLGGTTHTNAGDYSSDGWTFDGNANYNSASGSVHDSIAKANASMTVTPYSVTYDGNSHIATGSATGVKGEALAGLDLSATAHTSAGLYAADPWTFTDSTGNYNNASGTVQDCIKKANATVNVMSYSVTYDGNAHTATGTATGVKGEALSGLDLSGTTHINAGNYTDTWTFTDSTGNYNSASNTVSDSIAKAVAAITVTPYNVAYDGNAHTATGIATGVGGVNLSSSLTLSGTTHTDAGDYTADAWSFVGGTNYDDTSGTVHDAIAQVNASITVNGYSGVYDANAHGATGKATGVKGEDLSSLLNLGMSFTNVPGGTANWTFAGNTNYKPASGSVAITISKANQTISWSNPADIIYGTALSATQLDATVTGVVANDPTIGALTYSPLAGTVLNLGMHQALTVMAAATINYNQATATVYINVGYKFLGFYSPYAPPSTGVAYKINSAIPLQWQYADVNNNVVASPNANPQVYIAGPYACGGADSATEVLALSSGASGYQYSTTNNEWQFNLKTTGLAQGCYNVFVNTGSTGQQTVAFPIQLR